LNSPIFVVLFVLFVHHFFLVYHVDGTIIKPGPAQRIDPEPGRPGGWTGPGLIKDRLWQQPGQTRATRRVDPEDETRFFFFFNVEFETH
jgi:hypothetical protein